MRRDGIRDVHWYWSAFWSFCCFFFHFFFSAKGWEGRNLTPISKRVYSSMILYNKLDTFSTVARLTWSRTSPFSILRFNLNFIKEAEKLLTKEKGRFYRTINSFKPLIVPLMSNEARTFLSVQEHRSYKGQWLTFALNEHAFKFENSMFLVKQVPVEWQTSLLPPCFSRTSTCDQTIQTIQWKKENTPFSLGPTGIELQSTCVLLPVTNLRLRGALISIYYSQLKYMRVCHMLINHHHTFTSSAYPVIYLKTFTK